MAPNPIRKLARRLVLSAIIVLPTGSLAGCHTPPRSQQKLQAQQRWNRLRSRMKVRLATEQLESGRVGEAVVTLQEAIRLHPDAPALYRLLARCRLEQDDPRAAENALDHARDLGDRSADLAYTRGLIAEYQWRQDEALEHYTRAAAIDPNKVDYVVAVAESRAALGEFQEARKLLDDAMERFDRDPKLLLARAGICDLLGDLDQTAADFGDLTMALGHAPWAAERYGLVLLRLGRYGEALAALKPLVDDDRTFADADDPPRPPAAAVVRAVARCYNRLNRPAAARSVLDDYLHAHPDDARAWWVAAESAVLGDDLAAARRCLDRGRRLAPDLPQWDTLRAYVAWKSGNTTTARSILESLLAQHPDDTLAHCFLGEIFSDQKAPAAARRQFDDALKIDPNCAWARNRTQPQSQAETRTGPQTTPASPSTVDAP